MRRGLASLVFAAVALFGLVRSGLLRSLFSANYLPHRFCYLADPGLVWTNVTTDALIAASYALIFACILVIVRKLRGVSPLRPYLWIFVSFAAFIMACGLTHVMEVVTVWWPVYPLSAAMKVVCAAVSVPTALLFARATPVVARQIAGFFELLASYQRAVVVAADCRDQIEAIDRCQMMIEFNMDGSILRANEGVLTRFGYTHAELVGKDHSILLSEEDKAGKRQQELWEELRRGNFQSGEFRRVGAAGQQVWVEVRYTPICGADGLPRKVVAFATDETERVTERMANERRIRQAEAHLQAIVDNVLVGIVMIDGDGQVLSMNPAAVRMFGYGAGEGAGLNVEALIPGPDIIPRERHLAGYMKATKTARVGITRELQGVTRNGHVFPIELTISEVVGAGRRMFAGLVRDIKLRKRTEEERRRQELALRKSEELLERTGRLAGIGGWELDLETGELTWSAETCRILGADLSYRPTLESAMEMYAPQDRELLGAAIARTQSGGEGWDLELPVTTLDGRQIWARAVGTAEVVEGRAVRLWGAFQDITGRVLARKALDDANLRVALAAESGYVGIWDWDITSNKMIWDDWMCRLYGMEPQGDKPVSYGRWLDRVHVEDRTAVEQALQQAIVGTRPYDHSFRIVWSDGTMHHIRATGRVTRDAGGRAVRMVGHNIDMTDRKKVEEALRKSEAFLERTGRLAGVGGWEIDLTSSQVTWSPETYLILGADPAFRPTLQDAIDLYTPDSKRLLDAALERAFAEGEGFDLELSLVDFEGGHLCARTVGVVDFVDGRPARLWGAFQDITARAAERQALQEANTRASLAAASGGIGIWDWDIATGKVTADDGMYRISGLDPAASRIDRFEQWAGCLHPEDRPRVEQALRDGIVEIGPFHLDYRVLWPDGSLHYVKSSGQVVRDSAGRPVRMVGTNCDITDQKAAEDSLRRSSDNEKLLIHDLKDYAVVMLDPEGLIETWTEGAERITGYKAEEMIGCHFSKFSTPEEIVQGKPGQALQIAREAGHYEEEGIRLRKDGSEFWASVVLTAIFDESGQLRGYGKVTRYIGARRQSQAAA